MRFHLSDEQQTLQESLRRTIADVCPPGRRRSMIDANTDFDPVVWSSLMELGLAGLALPERFGGSGGGLLDLALAMEVLGETALPGPFLGHVLAALALDKANEEVREQWLERLVRGDVVATVAIAGDWDPPDWEGCIEHNTLTVDAPYVLGADRASLFIVGIKGGGLALVENAGQGIAIEPVPSSDLTRTLSKVSFREAPCTILPAQSATVMLNAALILLAADALGGASCCLRMSVEYAQTRRQFGVVIGQFQALKHQLANMALEIEPARALLWYAAHAADQGADCASRIAAHAKAHLADRFVSVARAAVQAHGGIGYTWEFDLHLWLRRSLFDRAYFGSPSLHRERAALMAGW